MAKKNAAAQNPVRILLASITLGAEVGAGHTVSSILGENSSLPTYFSNNVKELDQERQNRGLN